MPRQKKKRQHKLIGFKAYFDTDADILDWWEGIADGERSHVIRDVIRAYLGLPAVQRKAIATPATQSNIIQMPELVAVHENTEWIRNALNDMPDYIERVIYHVAAMQPTGTDPHQQMKQSTRAAPAPEEEEEENVLNDEEKKRRDKRMGNATW
ncbi:MAG: hypothetical protein AAFR67_02330 [Chloroflexota bacterium]